MQFEHVEFGAQLPHLLGDDRYLARTREEDERVAAPQAGQVGDSVRRCGSATPAGMSVGIIQRAGRGARDVLEEGPGDAARVETGRVERRPSHVERVQRRRAIDEWCLTRRGGRGEEIGETPCVERR